jgi:WD40 repeat protein
MSLVRFRQTLGSTHSLPLAALIVAALAFGSNQFAQQRRRSRIVTELTDVVYAMHFSADSRTLALARGSSEDNRVELWDAESGKLRRAIRGFDGPVWSVSFSPDGNTLVTGSGGIHQDKVARKPSARTGRPFTELKWWDCRTGELKQRLEFPDEYLVSIAAFHSPDGRLLATVENRISPAMAMFDNRGVLPPDPVFGTLRPSRGVTFDSDLKILDATTGAVRLNLKNGFPSSPGPMFRDLSPGDFLSTFLPGYRRQPIAFSPDGRVVAAWNADEIRLWNAPTGAEVL